MADWIRRFRLHSRHENSAATYLICRCKRTNMKYTICYEIRRRVLQFSVHSSLTADVPDVIADISQYAIVRDVNRYGSSRFASV